MADAQSIEDGVHVHAACLERRWHVEYLCPSLQRDRPENDAAGNLVHEASRRGRWPESSMTYPDVFAPHIESYVSIPGHRPHPLRRSLSCGLKHVVDLAAACIASMRVIKPG